MWWGQVALYFPYSTFLSVLSSCFLVVVGISSDLVLSVICHYLRGCSCTIWVVGWVCVVAMGYLRVMVKTLTNFLPLVFVLIVLRVVILDCSILRCMSRVLDGPWRDCNFDFVGCTGDET